jgi:hypothetical protein
METLLHEQKDKTEHQLRLQNIFFSFSSSVFMKTGQLLGLFLSGDDTSARQLAIQIFITSLSDATGDAYSLSVANTSSNLETYDIKALINFFLSFISKFLTGLIHVFLYSLGIPVKYILIVDFIMFYFTIGVSAYLIKKNQDIDMSFTKILTLQSIYGSFFLGLIVIISRLFVNYI